MDSDKKMGNHKRSWSYFPEIIHVQGVMLRDEVLALKVRTGCSNIKDALEVAVQHYLKCPEYKK